MTERIAVLGWGSLLWGGGRDFDAWHGPWSYDGPLLRIEFSRISVSRNGALTLVIDPKNGVPTKVAFCLSRRSNIAETIEDLRVREGTAASQIGNVHRAGGASSRDRESRDAILAWATKQDMDGVVWTDLPSNFAAKVGRPFSIASAVAYLQSLAPEARAEAVEYIRRAQPLVRTPLSEALADI